mmetsp:Transcript_26754/g.74994  ORF Transcript_26754/g.74994 Transcript_26754/m.74994 type:complete len:209 (-) Transcript_26754:836-1462(-)
MPCMDLLFGLGRPARGLLGAAACDGRRLGLFGLDGFNDNFFLGCCFGVWWCCCTGESNGGGGIIVMTSSNSPSSSSTSSSLLSLAYLRAVVDACALARFLPCLLPPSSFFLDWPRGEMKCDAKLEELVPFLVWCEDPDSGGGAIIPLFPLEVPLCCELLRSLTLSLRLEEVGVRPVVDVTGMELGGLMPWPPPGPALALLRRSALTLL